MLTNAVYFKGKWSDPFSADATHDGDFYAASGATQRARLMRQVTHARYFEGEGFQAAEFDYDDGEFALAVFLPRERAGLDAFERGLTGAHLDAWLERLTDGERARLNVTLPKVELERGLRPRPAARSRSACAGRSAMAPIFPASPSETPLAVSA